MTVEELTNVKIQQKLHEFLYDYRFEEKAKKLQKKKNITVKDQNLRKAKALKATE
jgi:hypothetical protein